MEPGLKSPQSNIHFFAVSLKVNKSWEREYIVVLFRHPVEDDDFDFLTTKGLPKHWMAYHLEGKEDSRYALVMKLPFFVPGPKHPDVAEVNPEYCMNTFRNDGIEPNLNIAVNFNGVVIEVEDLQDGLEPD